MEILLWLLLLGRILVRLAPWLIGVLVTMMIINRCMPEIPTQYFWLVFGFGVFVVAFTFMNVRNDIGQKPVSRGRSPKNRRKRL